MLKAIHYSSFVILYQFIVNFVECILIIFTPPPSPTRYTLISLPTQLCIFLKTSSSLIWSAFGHVALLEHNGANRENTTLTKFDSSSPQIY